MNRNGSLQRETGSELSVDIAVVIHPQEAQITNHFTSFRYEQKSQSCWSVDRIIGIGLLIRTHVVVVCHRRQQSSCQYRINIIFYRHGALGRSLRTPYVDPDEGGLLSYSCPGVRTWVRALHKGYRISRTTLVTYPLYSPLELMSNELSVLK